MSFLITNPEALTLAATSVRGIRDRAIQSDAEAAPATTAVRPPAADLVSARAATFLVDYARKYRQTIAAAAVVLEEFALALTTGAGKYATTEADNIKTI
ncbi:PE family protein [Mycobacterium decipiens]|uniref:PE family protein n=1 Tax=Mycobacterium decipiens TaxID=1430326 RepID=A0A1X2LWZ3_9MYCO|nr:PE family protein [Mycobacterium decipiens]OSC41664.1 PE family protein [Mycobacterium decipiens]